MHVLFQLNGRRSTVRPFSFTHRILQVLELGIVVHSVIIGLALGASKSSKTIKPLVAALSFHQFFEGIGLGGCISQVTTCLSKTQFLAVRQWMLS